MFDSSVRVCVRLRPFNEREMKNDTLPVVTASTDKNEVTLIRGSANRQQRQTYNFDSVFSTFSSQRDVFTTISPLVLDVLQGYEATVRNRPPFARPEMRIHPRCGPAKPAERVACAARPPAARCLQRAPAALAPKPCARPCTSCVRPARCAFSPRYLSPPPPGPPPLARAQVFAYGQTGTGKTHTTEGDPAAGSRV